MNVENLENRVTPSHTVSIVVPPTLNVSNVPEGTEVDLSSLVSGAVSGAETYNWQVTGDVTVNGGNTGSSFSFTTNDDGPVHVTLAVTDAGETANAPDVNLAVANVAPQDLTIDGPDAGVRGQALTFTSDFNDPGTDEFTFAWTVTRNGIPFTLPVGTVTNESDFSFTPTDSGSYVVSLTVTDDDGGVAAATHAVTVTAVAMQGDDLVVGGTLRSDKIKFVPNPLKLPGQPKVMGVKVFINGVSHGTYVVPGSIIVFAQAGNDFVHAAGSIQNNAIFFGGDGKDRLNGGAGNNVIVGGNGNDLLHGGKRNDILIGGDGVDRLVAGPGDDILIGDRTVFDTDPDALAKLSLEWASSSSYDDRVSHLSGTPGGLNDDLFFLVAGADATVEDDHWIDVLHGASGVDWFLSVSGKDRIPGKHRVEKLNN